MKKLLALFLSILTCFCFTSCLNVSDAKNQGSGNATTNQGNGNATTNNSNNSNLGDYNVVIDSCRLATDYSGNPVVIVKYQFTNNDNNPASFIWSVDDKVFQDGVGLNTALFVDDTFNYSSDNQTKDIKQGVSIYVEVAYELNDTTTDIEVEVTELISFNNKKVSKIFSISS